MTRLTDVIKPVAPDLATFSLDRFLWSYKIIDFIKLVLIRNRGYISRKIFNFYYELLEVSFLAYFCHPDFYAALLIIPFSSFFMNLINEELFSLNRSAVFDSSPISMRFNYALISTVFVLFIGTTGFLVQDIIRQHWILTTIFIARMALIAVQSFSFAYSLEIVTKKRVYFSPYNWWTGIALSFISVLILGASFSVQAAVLGGICAIYGSRIFIECRFIYSIKQLRKRKRNFKTSLFVIKHTAIRSACFLVTLSTLFVLSQLIGTENGQAIPAAVFFMAIFLLRIMNRPFRALQIDFINYLTAKHKQWVYLRHVQIIALNMVLFTPIVILPLVKSNLVVLVIPFVLLLWNLNALMTITSIGQEVVFVRYHIPIRLLSIIVYTFAPDQIGIIAFYVSEIILAIFSINIFMDKEEGIPRYLNGIKLGKNSKYSSLDHLEESRNHEGAYFVLNFNTDTRNHLKKLFAKALEVNPVLLTEYKWIIPQTHIELHELWKTFPRELRRVDLVNKQHLAGIFHSPVRLHSSIQPTDVETFEKKGNNWYSNGSRLQDHELIKLFSEIETYTSTALTLADRQFTYFKNGRYFYPLIKLGKVETIFVTNSYLQKYIDDVKGKYWQSLKSYFSS